MLFNVRLTAILQYQASVLRPKPLFSNYLTMLVLFQTVKFSGAVPTITHESPSLVSMATEAEPAQEEHENMKNLLIANDDHVTLRRTRAIRSKRT